MDVKDLITLKNAGFTIEEILAIQNGTGQQDPPQDPPQDSPQDPPQDSPQDPEEDPPQDPPQDPEPDATDIRNLLSEMHQTLKDIQTANAHAARGGLNKTPLEIGAEVLAEVLNPQGQKLKDGGN